MVEIFHILCPCTGTETADTCDCDLIQRNFYTRFQQFPEWKFLHEDSWNPPRDNIVYNGNFLAFVIFRAYVRIKQGVEMEYLVEWYFWLLGLCAVYCAV